jgi:hypothetical protein
MAILKGIGKPGSGAYLPGKLYREWVAKVRRHDQLEAALERIAKCETEVPGLAPEFYGHAAAIAEKALRVKSNADVEGPADNATPPKP